MAAEVRIRSFSSTDDDYTTAFLQTTNSDRCTQGASHGVSHGHMAYVNEDDMSTEEDDVFIRDPVKGNHGNNNAAVNKPLMHPRHHRPRVPSRVRWTCQRLAWSAVYLAIILMALAAFVCLIIYIVDVYAERVLTKTAAYQAAMDRLNKSANHGKKAGWIERRRDEAITPCRHVSVEDVWVLPVAKLLTESAIRLLDVNQDSVLDVVMGFATGADKHQKIPPVVCDMYFNGSYPCSGGLMAVHGRTGRELWRHYAQHEMFAVNCNADIDDDGVNDCLGGGRAGTFQAVSGRTGKLLWDFQDSESRNKDMNLYTAQFIEDVNDDGVPDVLQVHGGDPLGEPGSETRLPGKVMIFSGQDGATIQDLMVPDGRESYFSPVLYSRADGTKVVLFGTGGETHAGALWVIALHDLIKGQIQKAQRLYWDHYKGVMTPPVLIDITKDGTSDIVIAPFNSTLIAIDGESYKTLWNFSYGMSETYCTPSPGYYNDDDIPDFMVKFAHGPGYPIYYHAMTTVVDGKTGEPLLQPYIKETVGGQASPLTISVEGHGNDLFLYWIADCLQHEGHGGKFAFVDGTNVHEQSRSDFCRLRFKTRGFTQMKALSRHLESPGVTVYHSETRKELERSAWVNTTAEALRFLQTHPEYYADYRAFTAQSKAIEANRPENMYKHTKDKLLKPKPHQSIYNTVGLPYSKETDQYRHGSSLNEDPQQLLKNINKIYSSQGNQRESKDDDRLGNSYYDNSRYNVNPSEFSYLKTLLQKENLGDLSNQISEKLSDLVNRNMINKQTDYLPLAKRTKMKNTASFNKRVLHPVDDRKKMKIYDESLQTIMSNDDVKPDIVGHKQKSPKALPDIEKHLSSSIQKLREKIHIKTNKNHKTQNPRKRHKRKAKTFSPLADRRASHNKLHSINRQIKTSTKSGSQKKQSDSDVINLSQDTASDWHVLGTAPPRGGVDSTVEDFLTQEKTRLESSSRSKRHVGPHDSDGLQRLISTGTLAPPLLPRDHPDYQHAMDVIFAVYWFYPAKTQSVLPEDQRCMDGKMANESVRFTPSSKYYGMDHDAYKHAVTHECLEKSDHQMAQDGEYESQISYNPYNVHMGQMTLYRLRIKCTCGSGNAKTCARILPFEKQEWPAYMGRHGDSQWKSRK